MMVPAEEVKMSPIDGFSEEQLAAMQSELQLLVEKAYASLVDKFASATRHIGEVEVANRVARAVVSLTEDIQLLTCRHVYKAYGNIGADLEAIQLVAAMRRALGPHRSEL